MRSTKLSGARRFARGAWIFTTLFAMLAVLVIQTAAGAADGNPNERGEIYGADLQVDLTDAPDPVNSGNNLLLEAAIVNGGPDDALDIDILLEHDENLTFVDATFDYDFGDERNPQRGEGSFCFPDGEAIDVVDCDVAFLGAGDTLTVGFIMSVEDVLETTLASSYVEAFSLETYDPDSENNSDTEDTTLDPESDTESSGFIPPGGGNLTTDPGGGATETDPLVITMKVPAGPGGEASVNEETCDGPNDEFTDCLGNLLGNFVPPGGPGDYDQIIAELIYDYSVVAPGLKENRKPWQVDYQKLETDEVTTLEKCASNGNVVPCIKSFKRVPTEGPMRDLRVRVKIDSDPRLATRK